MKTKTTLVSAALAALLTMGISGQAQATALLSVTNGLSAYFEITGFTNPIHAGQTGKFNTLLSAITGVDGGSTEVHFNQFSFNNLSPARISISTVLNGSPLTLFGTPEGQGGPLLYESLSKEDKKEFDRLTKEIIELIEKRHQTNSPELKALYTEKINSLLQDRKLLLNSNGAGVAPPTFNGKADASSQGGGSILPSTLSIMSQGGTMDPYAFEFDYNGFIDFFGKNIAVDGHLSFAVTPGADSLDMDITETCRSGVCIEQILNTFDLASSEIGIIHGVIAAPDFPIPEPSNLTLLPLSFAAAAYARRRQKQGTSR